MKISCLQMDMALGRPEENFAHAGELIARAMGDKPDLILLPETWNTGFFPEGDFSALCDRDGRRTRELIGGLARRYGVNIAAGSVANIRDGRCRNTALVFDREGRAVAEYDKTHLFSPMGERRAFSAGDSLCRFELDGLRCGLMICYDLRFPELARSLSLPGLELLLVVSQWPAPRVEQLRTLCAARAIENQVYLACCNSCGKTPSAVFGGSSMIIDPLGNPLARAGGEEEIISAGCDMSVLPALRAAIPVFQDRRPELYRIY